MKKYTRYLTILLIILFFVDISLAKTVNDNKISLDSLRAEILSLEDTVKIYKAARHDLGMELDQVNKQIYDLKSVEKLSFISNISLKSKLKLAKGIADQIDVLDLLIQKKVLLQIGVYNKAIITIDQLLNYYFDRAKIKSTQKEDSVSILDTIATLNDEKERYSARLFINQNTNLDVKAIRLLPDDDLQKIRLKLFILEDELQSQQQLFGRRNNSLENLNDTKEAYKDMLLLYNDLEINLDDRFEFIDRNQSNEIRNRIIDLTEDISEVRQEIKVISNKMDSLNVKIEIFHRTIMNYYPKQDLNENNNAR